MVQVDLSLVPFTRAKTTVAALLQKAWLSWVEPTAYCMVFC